MNQVTIRYTPRQLYELMWTYHDTAQNLVTGDFYMGTDTAILAYLVLKDLRMRIAKRIDSGKAIKSFTYSAKESMVIHLCFRNKWIPATSELSRTLILELYHSIKQINNV